MELVSQWLRRPTARERLLIVSSVSIAATLVCARIVMQKRKHSVLKSESLVEKTAAAAQAMCLKPAFAKRLLELAAFKERVGHSDVPLGSSTGSKLVPIGLGKWVYAQRKRKADGAMKASEEASLTLLSFRWQLDPSELDVDEMIERLMVYKANTGDMLVPKKYEIDPLLGAWVAAMRRKADPLLNGGESELQPALRERLDCIGFSWEPARRCGSSFMSGFRIWSEAHVAGLPVPDEKWCNLQREAKRQGKLSEQRISYLDKFGFHWDVDADA